MGHHQHHHDTYINNTVPVALSQNARPSEPPHLMEEEAILDVDEPPDSSGQLMFKRQPIRSPTLSLLTNPMDGVIDGSRQKSLLTQGLSGEASSTPRPRSVVSSLSTESIASTAELTSDGGLTSPARTSTPSPPPPTSRISFNVPPLRKSDTVILAPVEPPKKRCITFACGKPLQEPGEQKKVEEVKKVDAATKRPCMIKFAGPAKPKDTAESKPQVVKKALIEPAVEDLTPKKLVSKSSFSRSPVILKKKRTAEALRFHEFASKHLDDDEWVYEKPRRQSKLTISDTLRKENEYRKLGEEAAAEALEAELEEDEEAMNAEDDDDLNDEEDDDEDEEDEEPSDIDSDGNESDNEAGFADSDDDSVEDNSDYQFWTTGATSAATSTEQFDHIRLKTRSASASSIESVVHSTSTAGHRRSSVVKRRRRPKMRPGTPELPDSTDFVCGTLDEDRPLEAAYRACIAQKKEAKRAVIPQDLDPTFPTSDNEDNLSEEEDDIGTANSQEGTWAAGHFDDFEMNQRRGRPGKSRTNTRSPSISPTRLKSPVPQLTRNRALAHTPPPTGRLFGRSPRRLRSPAPRHHYHPVSPPTSRRPSYDDRNMEVPLLAQRPNMTITKSLPRTPNPFWKEHRRQRQDIAAPTDESTVEIHSRGPIDIVQGLENKRRRRKEKFWLTHCRKEAKEKEKDRRRQPPGRGAKRMRELGLEAADRCKGYGHRGVPLVLSV